MMIIQAIASGRQDPQHKMVKPITISGMPNVYPMTVIIQNIRYELAPMKAIHIMKDNGYSFRVVFGFGMRQVVITRIGQVYSHQIVFAFALLYVGTVHKLLLEFFFNEDSDESPF